MQELKQCRPPCLFFLSVALPSSGHPSHMHAPVSWWEACISAFPDPSELEGESALVPGPHHGPEEGSGGHIPESTPRPRMCLVLCLSGPGVSEWGQLHLDHDD